MQDKDYTFTKKYPYLSYDLVAYTSWYEHTPSRENLCKIIFAHGLVEYYHLKGKYKAENIECFSV